MFVVSESEKGIPPEDREGMISVLHSINEPKIAAAERPAEPTRAFICEFGREPGAVEIKVVLYLTKSQVRLVYVSEEGTVEAARKKDLEAEALDFVENMGFMMDNMNLAKMAPAERQPALAELPIFGEEVMLESVGDLSFLEDPLTEEPLEVVEGEIPIVTRAKPKPVASVAEFDDSLSLEALELEFRRDEGGIADVDSALDSMLGSRAEETGTLTGPTTGMSEGGAVTRWRTIVRFLASF
jgi:hypothetical protein